MYTRTFASVCEYVFARTHAKLLLLFLDIYSKTFFSVRELSSKIEWERQTYVCVVAETSKIALA